MPWRFEERTSLAVPRRGLSWRHLKASTQSTNEIRGQPGAPSRQAYCAPLAPHLTPCRPRAETLRRFFHRGGEDGEKRHPRLHGSGVKSSLCSTLTLLLTGTGAPSSLRPLPCCPVRSGEPGDGGALGHRCGPRGGKLGRHGARVSEGLSLLSVSQGWGDLSTPRSTTLGCSPPQAPQACHAFHFLTKSFL